MPRFDLQRFQPLLEKLHFTKERAFWIAVLGAPIALLVVAVLASMIFLAPQLPSLEQLENIKPKLVTRVYDKDSLLVHEFFVERRVWTSIDSMPDLVKKAVIATEDRVFYDHWGMNPWAIPSAVLETVLQGKKLRGASTLTQQLAKLMFLSPERSVVRKMKEAMTAIRIEQTYTKEEILEFYLNEVYLGAGNYGFQAAGQYYFGRPLDSLEVHEIAVLTGMLQRPEGYRPDRHPEVALERRNTVLYAMKDAGVIDDSTYDVNVKIPIETKYHSEKGPPGPYYMEEIRKHLEKKFGENSLYADGVHVYSTIDPAIQIHADSLATKHVERVRKKLKYRATWQLGLSQKYKMPADSIVVHFDSVYALFSKEYLAKDTARLNSNRRYPDSLRYQRAEIAMILIENGTGAVRALVGGSDFSKTKFNRAVQSMRQPGSSFKPFVYAVAMDNGASPCDSVSDQPLTIQDPTDPTGKTYWRPANYDKDFEGQVTLRKALYQSKNLPAILTGMKYGLDNVVRYAHKFGIKSKLEAVPSLAIGSIGATLWEMTAGYTVFPNNGMRIEPYFIESIVSKNGEVMERHKTSESEVIKPAAAYIMVNMLQDVNIRGTAAKVWASGFVHPSGGKTGTTNDYTDAWYIGFTKQYTMGVWVGTDVHVPMGAGHTGGDDALPYWIDVMKELHKGKPLQHFPMPGGVVSKSICQNSGKVAGDYCSMQSTCLYTSGFVPKEVCDGNHAGHGSEPAKDATLFGGQTSTPKGKNKPSKNF